MKFQYYILLAIAIIFSKVLYAFDSDSTKSKYGKVSISGYVDAYYALYTDSLPIGALQKYTTVSPESNLIGLNIAQLTASYEHAITRAQITLHHGDIARATWDPRYHYIQEGYVGLKLYRDWWLYGGLFATHLGTESFLPKNNWVSSTSVATYIGPFFQAGMKLAFEKYDGFTLELWGLNGYNQFDDINSAKSFGLLLGKELTENLSIGYSNITGNEALPSDTVRLFRIYNNAYLNYETDRIGLQIGGDVATQSNSNIEDNTKSALLYNILATFRFKFNDQLSITSRIEYYNDNSAIVSVPTLNTGGKVQGLELIGGTLGLEYKPSVNSFIRLETRYITTPDQEMFTNYDGNATTDRMEGMFTFGMWFGND